MRMCGNNSEDHGRNQSKCGLVCGSRRGDEKYDYSRPELWEYIQYLPKELGNTQFYVPWMTSNYEKALAENYRRILKHGRTSDIKKLNQQNK